MKRPFSVNNLDTDKLEIPEKLTTTNIANLITPKIQVFPIIDNINTILEQRNDFSPARERSGKFIHAASITSSPQQKLEQHNSYASLLKVKSIPSGIQSVQNLDSYSYSPLIPIKNVSTQDSNVHINLETQDYSDMEEFNDEPPVISNVHLNGKTPHSSPYKKSMKNIAVKMNNSLAKLSNENTPVKSLNNVCWDDVHHNEKTDLCSREEFPDNMMHFQHHHNIKENSSNIDQDKFQRKARR